MTLSEGIGESGDRLRGVALLTVLAGAVGSVSLMLRAGQSSDEQFLVVLIAGWVSAPFGGLLLAHVLSKRWSQLTRATLYRVMLVLPLASLLVYATDAWRNSGAQDATVFVAVPLASWPLIGLALSLAAFTARRRSRRGGA